MNIIKLDGGLGNQMFQYALYMKYSSLGYDVAIDDSCLKADNNPHGDKCNIVSAFNVEYKKGNLNCICNYSKYKNKRCINTIYFSLLQLSGLVRIERNLSFHKNYLRWNNSYIDGYWQSPLYFEDISASVKAKYTFYGINTLLSDEQKEYFTSICSTNSVSIHVRRGDYLSERNRKLDTAYYFNSINYMNCRTVSPHYFVFSDDIEWCKQKLSANAPITYINSDYKTPYIDMYLMTKCKHNIIANSTFSWWGAWLNCEPSKIVVAPLHWFNDGTKIDIIPSSWVGI